MSTRYRCAWCAENATTSTTSAGWPICAECWNAGADGYAPTTYQLEEMTR